MNKNSYVKYKEESQGWLHIGRSALIGKIIGFYIDKGNQNLAILDVGAGVGQNISTLSSFGLVDALEVEEIGLNELAKRSDLGLIISEGIPCRLNKKYDVIGAFDVIEHIENDREAVQWICDHLKPGGIFILTVPAFQWFYSEHDRALGHYRRYSSNTLKKLLPKDVKLLSESYFNFFLFPIALFSRMAWLTQKFLLGRRGSSSKQPTISHGRISRLLLKVFLKEIEVMSPKTKWPFGLSYYACFKKI